MRQLSVKMLCDTKLVISEDRFINTSFTAATIDTKIVVCEENTADSKSSSNSDALLSLIRYCGKLPTYPEALNGRGTTYAFQRELDYPISDFTELGRRGSKGYKPALL